MKQVVCILCPTGCHMQAEMTPQGFVVRGNGCKRGADFAQAELTNPTRMLCTTVRTCFAEVPVLPVRTEGEIPKGLLREAMQHLGGVVVDKPLRLGETVVENLLGTGVAVVATSDVLQEKSELV